MTKVKDKKSIRAEKKLKTAVYYDLALLLFAGLTNSILLAKPLSQNAASTYLISNYEYDGLTLDYDKLDINDFDLTSDKYAKAQNTVNKLKNVMPDDMLNNIHKILDSLMLRNIELVKETVNKLSLKLRKYKYKEFMDLVSRVFIEEQDSQLAEWLTYLNLIVNGRMYIYDFESNSVIDFKSVEVLAEEISLKETKENMKDFYEATVFLMLFSDLDNIVEDNLNNYSILNPCQVEWSQSIADKINSKKEEMMNADRFAQSTLTYLVVRHSIIHYIMRCEFKFDKITVGNAIVKLNDFDLRKRKKVIRPEGVKIDFHTEYGTNESIFKEFHDNHHLLLEASRDYKGYLNFTSSKFEKDYVLVSHTGILAMSKLVDIFEIYDDSVEDIFSQFDMFNDVGYIGLELTTPKCWVRVPVTSDNSKSSKEQFEYVVKKDKVIEIYAHVRRCNGKASEEAKRLAKKYLLKLEDGYTIVKTHERHYKQKGVNINENNV